MSRITPELVVIVIGLGLLAAGLTVWLGWAVAAAVVGLLLVLAGLLSAMAK